ncbi:DNA recombination protein RmuC [Carboxydothermus hydrogenoformans]|uniref:RmuC domain protein n=1 Tax=Carboxydothermus hydrogenoformans (strain ATCC BAA-161 / DSM 6008 / Z-2901) TaxID=246194 RepID=Q3A9E3_CARHZ|nr:DNA recombination protein RmuC [Carboxydothermus hydrogenoformans]ABB15418.1 RmuC domain protein [Carboxydothermus hydrogenoformans Z-2901]
MEIFIFILLFIILIFQIILFMKIRFPERESLLTGINFLKELLSSLNSTLREEAAQNRKDLSDSLRDFRDTMLGSLSQIGILQKNQLEAVERQLSGLMLQTEQRLEAVRKTVEDNLHRLQEDNAKKLEEMRATVDEKLQGTLERRLSESFRLISERLEQVQRGLGEMQALAAGVGDLKKVLTNVKTRGTLGEIQLGAILEQIFAPEQYEKNIATKKGSEERVEFAIKLPGQKDGPVWLPIDAKFPTEDYQRLLDAIDKGDALLAEEAAKALENRIKDEARKIREKYLDPPHTTDFAIMFLPSEGLYAEVLRRNGLVERLQREYRVAVAGPTTLAAFLNSLQMGFRTLAIEKRSLEVWTLLGEVKTEFARFGEALDKTRKKLEAATNEIDNAVKKTRNIEKKLSQVQELPQEGRF